jgi:hypothetical protein
LCVFRGFACKDPCRLGNIEQSVHVLANGALHSAGTCASTRADKSNSKVKDSRSLQDDLCLKQRHQTDLPEALELNDHTMIGNSKIPSSFQSYYFSILTHHLPILLMIWFLDEQQQVLLEDCI